MSIGLVLTLFLTFFLGGRELYRLLPVPELSAPVTAQGSAPDTCTLTLVPITDVPIGISNEPAINRRGDKLAFWSTANLPLPVGSPANNLDGNIEIFLSKVGIGFNQITDSRGSILGGFNLSPSMDASGNKIAFFSDRDLTGNLENTDNNFEIFLATITGSGVSIIQITRTTGGANILPSISADGSRIAFISDSDLTGTKRNADENQELFVAQLVPGMTQPLFVQVTNTLDGINDQPVISGDGTSIAFVADHNFTGQNGDRNLEIFRAQLTPSGSSILQVTSTTGRTHDQLSIDDDGSNIVYLADSGPGGGYQVWLARSVSAASPAAPLAVNGGIAVSADASPSISDDGSRIVFASEGTPTSPSRLYLYDSVLGGLLPDPLTGTTGNAEQPAISGSGADVVFISDHEGRRQVYVAQCPLAGVQLQKTTQQNPVVAGEMITYTVRVTNNGPSTANDVVMTDTLPTKLEQSTITVDSGCALSGRTVTCALGSMLAETSKIVTIAGRVGPLERGQISNSAVVTTSAYNRDLSDNTDTTVVDILAQVALDVTKSGTPDPALAGSTLDYTITVKNVGLSTGTNVRFTDTLPSGFAASSFTTSQGSCSLNSSSLICTLGNLAANGSATIGIKGNVSPSARGHLVNTALATAFEHPEGAQATATTSISTLTTLSLTKSDAPDPVFANQLLTYTLTARNHGPSTATNVVLTDPLPAHFLNPVFGSVSQGSCSITGHSVTCPLGTLLPGQAATVVLRGQVAPLARAPLTNTARVVSAEDATGVQSSQITTVRTQADLRLTKSDSPDPVIAGNTLIYLLSVTNDGPSVATGVVLTDTFSSDLTLPSAVPSQGSCSFSGTTLRCELGNIPPATSATVTLKGTVTPSAPGSLSNTATVRAIDFDPELSDNSVTVNTTVERRANLRLTKVDSPDPVIAGEALTYTLVLTNDGPSIATGVTLADNLPAALTSATASASQGSCSNGPVVSCNLNSLLPGDSITIVINGTVNPQARDSLSNTATAAAAESDPLPGNNGAMALTTVQTKIDLSLSKSGAPDPVVAGTTLTYYLTVTNDGPSSATSVVLTDTLSLSSLTVTPNQGSCAVNGATVLCSLATVLPGSQATVRIAGTVSPAARTSIANSAEVSAAEPDSDPTSNSTMIHTTITTLADLRIGKRASANPIAGSDITYTIVVTNTGPSTADSVTVSDVLSTVLGLPSATTMTDGSCVVVGGAPPYSVRCQRNAELLVNGVTEVSITAPIDQEVRGNLSNTASATSAALQPDPDGASATIVTAIGAVASLDLDKSSATTSTQSESEVKYTLTITNSGPSSSQNTVVTDTLPAGSVYVGATPSANCTQVYTPPIFLPPTGSPIVRCELGTIFRGSTGVTTFEITATLRSAGAPNINAAQVVSSEDPSGDTDTQAVTVTAGPPCRLYFRDQPPATIAAGIPFTVTLGVQDCSFNPTTDSLNREVSLSLNNANGATIQGSTVTNSSTGVFTFTNLVIQKTSSTPYSLRATESSANGSPCPGSVVFVYDPNTNSFYPLFVPNPNCLAAQSVDSGTFAVTSGALGMIQFIQPPVSAAAGSSISPPIRLRLYDVYGNVATHWAQPITLRIGNDPNGAGNSPYFVNGVQVNPPAGATATQSGGIVTYTQAISITKVGAGFTLLAASTNGVNSFSAPFNITAASAADVSFIQQPTTTTAGAVMAPTVTVQVRDAYGNPITSGNASISVNNSGVFSPTATTTAPIINGVASFDNLILTKVGTFNLSATVGSLTPVASTSFNITVGALASLRFVQQPGNTTAGVDFNPAITVQVADAWGNARTDNNLAIAMAIGSSNPPGGVLDGTTSRNTNASGLATFNNLNIDEAGSYTLIASRTGLTSATSTSFTISAAAANELQFLVQPSTVIAGGTQAERTFASAIQVAVMDQFSNIVTTDNSTGIQIGLRDDTGIFAVDNGVNSPAANNCTSNNVAAAYPKCVRVVNGVATFTGLYLESTMGADTYHLGARRDGSTDWAITSDQFLAQ